jgi:cold shock CspA family protein
MEMGRIREMKRNYGFIRPHGRDEELFFHVGEVVAQGPVRAGDVVEYVISINSIHGKRNASGVRVVSRRSDQRVAGEDSRGPPDSAEKAFGPLLDALVGKGEVGTRALALGLGETEDRVIHHARLAEASGLVTVRPGAAGLLVRLASMGQPGPASAPKDKRPPTTSTPLTIGPAISGSRGRPTGGPAGASSLAPSGSGKFKGVVKLYKETYGFIVGPAHDVDLFFHIRSVQGVPGGPRDSHGGWKVSEGDEVEFSVAPNPKTGKLNAIHVQLLGGSNNNKGNNNHHNNSSGAEGHGNGFTINLGDHAELSSSQVSKHHHQHQHLQQQQQQQHLQQQQLLLQQQQQQQQQQQLSSLSALNGSSSVMRVPVSSLPHLHGSQPSSAAAAGLPSLHGANLTTPQQLAQPMHSQSSAYLSLVDLVAKMYRECQGSREVDAVEAIATLMLSASRSGIALPAVLEALVATGVETTPWLVNRIAAVLAELCLQGIVMTPGALATSLMGFVERASALYPQTRRVVAVIGVFLGQAVIKGALSFPYIWSDARRFAESGTAGEVAGVVLSTVLHDRGELLMAQVYHSARLDLAELVPQRERSVEGVSAWLTHHGLASLLNHPRPE